MSTYTSTERSTPFFTLSFFLYLFLSSAAARAVASGAWACTPNAKPTQQTSVRKSVVLSIETSERYLIEKHRPRRFCYSRPPEVLIAGAGSGFPLAGQQVKPTSVIDPSPTRPAHAKLPQIASRLGKRSSI